MCHNEPGIDHPAILFFCIQVWSEVYCSRTGQARQQNSRLYHIIRRLFLSASFSKDAGNAGFPTCCLKKDADNHFMSAHKSWQVHPHHPATSVPAELPVHRRCLFPWLLSFAPMKGWHNGLLWFQLKNAPALWISG